MSARVAPGDVALDGTQDGFWHAMIAVVADGDRARFVYVSGAGSEVFDVGRLGQKTDPSGWKRVTRA